MNPAVTLFLRAMLARSYPRVIGLARAWSWVLQETLMPIMSVSAFAIIYQALGTPEYVGFVILGGAMAAFWLNVLWSMAAQFYWDRDAGNLELFIVSPASLMAILAGMALGGMVMTLIRATVIVVAGALIFGVTLAPVSWWGVGGVFLLTLLALYGLGMVFASSFLFWGREAWHIVNLLQEPVYLLSGMNFPVSTLIAPIVSAPLRSLSVGALSLLPLTLGMDALRQLLFPQSPAAALLSPAWETLLLGLLTVVFLALAWWCLRYLERRARQEGRLTVRWQ